MQNLSKQLRELEHEKTKWTNEAEDFSKVNSKYLNLKSEKAHLEVKHADLSSEYSSVQMLLKDKEGASSELTKRYLKNKHWKK